MRYLTGTLRVLLFLILFLFALKNHELATLKFYFDLEWKAPLVLLLLIFFSLGIAAGVLACLPRMFRQRRESLALTSQLKLAAASPKAPVAPRDGPPYPSPYPSPDPAPDPSLDAQGSTRTIPRGHAGTGA